MVLQRLASRDEGFLKHIRYDAGADLTLNEGITNQSLLALSDSRSQSTSLVCNRLTTVNGSR